MNFQELLQKYIKERQKEVIELLGGEVIELTLFATWLDKMAAQTSAQPDNVPETEDNDGQYIDASGRLWVQQ